MCSLPFVRSAKIAAICQCSLNLPLTTNFVHHTSTDAITSQVIYTLHHLHHAATITYFVLTPGHCDILGHNIVDATVKTPTHLIIHLINPPHLKEHICWLLTNAWNIEWTRSYEKLCSIKSTVQDWTKWLGKRCGLSRLLEIAANCRLFGYSRIAN